MCALMFELHGTRAVSGPQILVCLRFIQRLPIPRASVHLVWDEAGHLHLHVSQEAFWFLA